MSEQTVIGWSLPGYADDVALSAANGRLWVAASTATLASEDVWFGAVTGVGVAGATRVLESGPCCRPAIAALGDGALAVACAPDRLVGAYVGADGAVRRWAHALDGVPVHVATVAEDSRVWLAVELVRGSERFVLLLAVDPASGTIAERHQLGGAARWCRWPALAIDAHGLVIAWSEGAARMPGTIKIARWGKQPLRAHDVSSEPGEAPALARMPDGAFAVAWHHGGASVTTDHRDASVVRIIDVAIVRPDEGAIVTAAPPPGAGGTAPRGEDQGWELAAIAADARGSLVLVGRSSHGHHVARRSADGAWTATMALDAGGWGGRGRRHALVIDGDRPWLARRAPEGVIIGVCPEPPRDGAPARTVPIRQPRRIRSTTPGVLFGDLHQHTALSDGCGSVEDLWIAARDQRGLDFAAVTDHDQFCRRALGPATWQLTREVANGFDDPGSFVAIAAYEFTGPRHPGPGHKCVYFGDRVPDRVPDRDVDTLFALLREVGGIAVPHHVAWTGADFAHHDPHIQPVWEICSVHGCYEADGACPAHPPRADFVIPGHFVRDALDAGLRFGFIGSTDSHGLDWHHGIARWRNPFRSGLACLVGAELTREGVLAAMRARRSYATTGAKIALRVELDGAPLGSELPRGTTGELLVEVTGTAPVTSIAVVRAGAERALDVDRSGASARARVRLTESECTGYLYVRVEQADGEAAWASPFWFGGT